MRVKRRKSEHTTQTRCCGGLEGEGGSQLAGSWSLESWTKEEERGDGESEFVLILCSVGEKVLLGGAEKFLHPIENGQLLVTTSLLVNGMRQV